MCEVWEGADKDALEILSLLNYLPSTTFCRTTTLILSLSVVQFAKR